MYNNSWPYFHNENHFQLSEDRFENIQVMIFSSFKCSFSWSYFCICWWRMLWTFQSASILISLVVLMPKNLNLCTDNSILGLFFTKLNINSILSVSGRTWLSAYTISNGIFLSVSENIRPHFIALKAIKHEICGLNAGKNE